LISENKDHVYAAVKKRQYLRNPKHTENYCIALPDGSNQWVTGRSFTVHGSRNKSEIISRGVEKN